MTDTRYFAVADYPGSFDFWVFRSGTPRDPMFLVRAADFGNGAEQIAVYLAEALNCRAETDSGRPLSWGGRGCERDIEERRIEEADAEEVAREQRGFTHDDAEHLDQQPEDAQ